MILKKNKGGGTRELEGGEGRAILYSQKNSNEKNLLGGLFQRILGSSPKFQVPGFCNHILLTVTPRTPWRQKARLSLMSSRPSCYAKDAVALWLPTCVHACSWPPLWLPTKSPKPVLTTLWSAHNPHYGSHYSQGTSDFCWPDPRLLRPTLKTYIPHQPRPQSPKHITFFPVLRRYSYPPPNFHSSLYPW